MTNIRYGRKFVMKRGCGSLLRSSTAAGLRSGGTGQPYIGKNYPKPIYWHISDYQQIIDIKKWNFLIIKIIIYIKNIEFVLINTWKAKLISIILYLKMYWPCIAF